MNKEMEREKEKDRPLVGVVVEQGDIRRVILGGTIWFASQTVPLISDYLIRFRCINYWQRHLVLISVHTCSHPFIGQNDYVSSE